MHIKKSLCLMVVTLSLVGLISSACAKSTPPSVPAPTPTPSPTLTPTAKPTPAATPHAQFYLTLSAGAVGQESYLLGYGMADMINKYHPWLRAIARTSGGSADDAMQMIKEPAIRKNTIFVNTNASMWAAQKGVYGFNAYDGQRMLWVGNLYCAGFVTLNPNIKEIKDLIGKRVGLLPAGAATNVALQSALLGVDPDWEKKIKCTPMALNDGMGALRDGLLDAYYSSTAIPQPGVMPWNLSGWTIETFLKPTAHYINAPKEVLLKGAERGGFPNAPMYVPAGAITKDHPAFTTWAHQSGFGGDIAMPDEVAYEIAKFVYEHIGDFGNYSAGGKAYSKENIAMWGLGDEAFHPGALKFWKEVGVPTGKG